MDRAHSNELLIAFCSGHMQGCLSFRVCPIQYFFFLIAIIVQSRHSQSGTHEILLAGPAHVQIANGWLRARQEQKNGVVVYVLHDMGSQAHERRVTVHTYFTKFLIIVATAEKELKRLLVS